MKKIKQQEVSETICDNCKGIVRPSGIILQEYYEHELQRDWDFCSPNCFVKWIKSKKAHVVEIESYDYSIFLNGYLLDQLKYEFNTKTK